MLGLGTITTVAAIALANAVTRPIASKDDGWNLSWPQELHYVSERAPTDQLILAPAAFVSNSTYSQYPSPARARDRVSALQDELSNYLSLAAGWDGDGSLPAKADHIDAAGRILKLLPAGIPMPRPMLSSDGEVGLYWKNSEYLADAVIEDADHFSLFIRSLKNGNQETFIASIAITLDATAAITSAFQSA